MPCRVGWAVPALPGSREGGPKAALGSGWPLRGHLRVEDVGRVARSHTLCEERGEVRPVVVKARVVAQEEPTGHRGDNAGLDDDGTNYTAFFAEGVGPGNPT